jgi:dipeptidyl aminopeptidase/acylaminoacyl peptidase
MNTKSWLLGTALLGLSLALGAQTARPTLSIDKIMLGDRFVGFLPENINWSEDSKTVYFTWNPKLDTLRSLYKVLLGANAQPLPVPLEEQRELAFGGAYNRSFTKKVYAKDGDIFWQDLATGKITAITNTVETESNPQFLADDSKVVYQFSGNLFLWNSANGSTTQLTNFKTGMAKADKKPLDYEQELKEDQMELSEMLRWRKGQKDIRERQSKLLAAKRPKEIYLGNKQVTGLQVSPDLKFVTLRLVKRAEPRSAEVPNYVTESGFTENITARSKVGSPQDTYEMGILDLSRDTFYTIEPKNLEGILDKPAFLKEYHQGKNPYKAQYEKPREVSYQGPVFSEDGKAVFSARALDSKDRWILLLDLATGKYKQLDHQHDDAWIGGPGVDNFFGGNATIGWLADNQTIWFQSEVTGFSHIYTLNTAGGEKKALTQGKFEVIEARLSRNKQFFYLTATAEGPHQRHFYKLPVGGVNLEKITPLVGGNEVSLSPDEQHLAIRYSYSNKPWELYLMDNQASAKPQQITHSTTADFQQYPWRDPEIVWFTASDGVKVPSRLYRSAKKSKAQAAVIFVHGAGYAQNVHQWWASYFREYLFHNYLADQGYTVLDIDYRASSGYGRDWRTGIYRYMGGKDLSDQVDGANYLIKEQGVDPQRIGIYGGSYGGFITLMALFNAPSTFKSGAALRPVTDWAHYNHGYTSNILNSPVEDSIAYRRSSPIFFAEGLKGNLLMLHGMVDVNVHFQDVVRLSQRLIELKKENWELAVFPLEDHGFVEASSWADEYKRIFKLFESTLKK